MIKKSWLMVVAILALMILSVVGVSAVATDCIKNTDCSEGYACNLATNECRTSCTLDTNCKTLRYECDTTKTSLTYQECVLKATAIAADTAESTSEDTSCIDSDCEGGFKCDATTDECLTFCTKNLHCQITEGYSCNIDTSECENTVDLEEARLARESATTIDTTTEESTTDYCGIGEAECSNGINDDEDDETDFYGACDTDDDEVADTACTYDDYNEDGEIGIDDCVDYCTSLEASYIDREPDCFSPLDNDETVDTTSSGAPSLAPSEDQGFFGKFWDWITFWN